MSTSRVLQLVFGTLASLLAVALLVGGGFVLWAHETQRDDAGFYSTRPIEFSTSAAALYSDGLDVAHLGDWPFGSDFADIRLQGSAADPSRELFVGIGPEADVRAYLAGVAAARVTDVDLDDGRFSVSTQERPGRAVASPPAQQTFWAASVEGAGEQTLEWNVDRGDWSVVVMNADGSTGVDARLSLGAKVGFDLPLAIGFLAGGGVLLVVGALLIYLGARSRGLRPPGTGPSSSPEARAVGGTDEADRTTAGVASVGSAHPVQLEAELDPTLSRWMWLVKWFLAIPHLVVLFFLWISFGVLTVVAFFGILFTERYPRGIFEFNVGVLRWSWRVAYYAFGQLGSDRYPPFSLGPEPYYPATLEIPYPERLSRGLVLVKWWLLAIPHYVVIGFFNGGWGLGPWFSPGLIGVLVLIAAVALLFTERYPRDIFDLVLGMNRWTYRVVAYAALMRDEYPPFRLGR